MVGFRDLLVRLCRHVCLAAPRLVTYEPNEIERHNAMPLSNRSRAIVQHVYPSKEMRLMASACERAEEGVETEGASIPTLTRSSAGMLGLLLQTPSQVLTCHHHPRLLRYQGCASNQAAWT